MKRLKFETDIKAPASEIWNILWRDETYRKWTAVFTEGSYAISDWKEGSPIRFMSPEGEGMISEIARKIPNEMMSFMHLGMLKNGKEVMDGDEVKTWKGAMENYHLKSTASGTRLLVELDMSEDQVDYFKDAFPKALQKVKTLAEGKS